jgi:hypothetical protein
MEEHRDIIEKVVDAVWYAWYIATSPLYGWYCYVCKTRAWDVPEARCWQTRHHNRTGSVGHAPNTAMASALTRMLAFAKQKVPVSAPFRDSYPVLGTMFVDNVQWSVFPTYYRNGETFRVAVLFVISNEDAFVAYPSCWSREGSFNWNELTISNDNVVDSWPVVLKAMGLGNRFAGDGGPLPTHVLPPAADITD